MAIAIVDSLKNSIGPSEKPNNFEQIAKIDRSRTRLRVCFVVSPVFRIHTDSAVVFKARTKYRMGKTNRISEEHLNLNKMAIIKVKSHLVKLSKQKVFCSRICLTENRRLH